MAERTLDHVDYALSHTREAYLGQVVVQWKMITGVSGYKVFIGVFHQGPSSSPFKL